MFDLNRAMLRSRLAQKSPLGVFWMSVGSATVLELAANAKPEAIVIDAQHVAAARVPPQGLRSAGGVRPLSSNFPNYYAQANARTVVGVMIETQRGVHNASAIVNTPGIDFVLIGTGDLAISLGSVPTPDPRHEQACRTVLEACKAARIPCAIYTGNADAAIKRRSEGYTLVVVANDIDVVSRGFSSAMTKFTQDPGKSVNATDGEGSDAMSTAMLMNFASAIADGRIKVIDLTQTLMPSTPVKRSHVNPPSRRIT